MSFEVTADAYGRFMGRYSEQLAVQFADSARLAPGQKALDVGCGPGALTAQLVERVGHDHVAAVDPSPPFVDAARTRFPGLDVRRAAAEQLPFDDGTFDAALAQLVVHFMTDPVAGLREMGRVTRPGGLVAACVWDLAGNRSPLSTFWSVVREIDPSATTESGLAGARSGQLVELAGAAGLTDPVGTTLAVTVTYPTFEEWWDPYLLGVGPSGGYVAAASEARRAQLRERCREVLGDGPVEVVAHAWCMHARVGDEARGTIAG
jgi:SAM-dependent methyltransferase